MIEVMKEKFNLKKNQLKLFDSSLGGTNQLCYMTLHSTQITLQFTATTRSQR